MFNYIVVHVPVTLTSQTMQWINVCVKASVTDCKAYFYQLAFCQAIYAFYCVGFFSCSWTLLIIKFKVSKVQNTYIIYFICSLTLKHKFLHMLKGEGLKQSHVITSLQYEFSLRLIIGANPSIVVLSFF